MPTYGKIKVNTLTYDVSGSATDLAISTIATDTDLGLKANLAGPTFTGTINGASLILSGDLTVNGTTTTIDTTNLDVEDKNITLGKVDTPSDATADGGGITLKGATDKTINWVNSTDAWTFSENINIAAGKKLGVGGSDYGTSGHVLTSGGSGAAPSWAAPAAGGNTFTAVANGSIANNKAVQIDTDGKVSQVAASVSARTAVSAGTYGVVNSGEDDQRIWNVRCGDNLVMMIYQDTTNSHGAARVTEITTATGTTLSTGAEATFTQSSPIDEGYDACYMGSNKVFIAWFGTGNKVNTMIATVNPSTKAITFGSIVTAESNSKWPAVSYDADEDKVLLCYAYSSTTPKGVVCSVSGTTITLGTPVTMPTVPGAGNQATRYTCSCYDTNVDKHIIGMRHETNDTCNVIAATVSGTSVSFGAWTLVHSDSCRADLMDITFNSNRNAFAIVFRVDDEAKVCSGTCASNGTITIQDTEDTISTNSGSFRFPSLVYEPISTSMVVACLDNSAHIKMYMISMAANYVMTKGAEVNTRNYETNYLGLADSGRATNGALIASTSRWDQGSNQRGLLAAVISTTESVSNFTDGHRYVGYADQAYTNGQTATIKTTGNNITTLSGLTPGSKYYVQGDGTVATSAGSPACLAGLALSSSKLLIREGKSDV